jgi:acetoin utilization deacetylase AcuC-like enzyme
VNRVALVYGEASLKHETGLHSDSKQRASATYDYLRAKPLFKKLVKLVPREATAGEVTLVHARGYLNALLALPDDEFLFLDADTVFGPGSMEAALSAAGAVTLAVDQVKAGAIDAAFCLVRPPGHHARPARAMGFCILNNVAIGAAYAARVCGLGRAAIIDFDVHHGNGTQEMFYDSADVLYCSIHQWPFYPGTGLPRDSGDGKGWGKTVNVPLPGGSGEKAYMEALAETILPAVCDHRPGLILISAGFDAHEADPIGGMALSTESFGKITRAIARTAREICGGKMISALEGGYNINALAASVHSHIEALIDQ